MNRYLRITAALVLSGLVLAACGSSNGHSSTTSAPVGGYGLVVGNVGPCTAKQFDASPNNPLIATLTKGNKSFDTYNVSTDQGTTSYHFDVPVGHYELTTTWSNSKVTGIVVNVGKTLKVNVTVSCWVEVPGTSSLSPTVYAQQLHRAGLKAWEVCAPTYRPSPGYDKIAVVSPYGVGVLPNSYVNIWVGGNPPGCHKIQKHEGPVNFHF